MAKTIFEEMSGTYTQVVDYLLPDLKLPEEEQQPIGVWGQRHRRYLKDHRRTTYAALFTNGKLNSYLADIDRQGTVKYYAQIHLQVWQNSVCTGQGSLPLIT